MFLTLSLQTKQQFNAIPHVSPIILLSFHRFFIVLYHSWWILCFFLALMGLIVLTSFTMTLQKVRKLRN